MAGKSSEGYKRHRMSTYVGIAVTLAQWMRLSFATHYYYY
jgi:hypothetical protein